MTSEERSLAMETMQPKVVAYSKTAPFAGGEGYLLWELEVANTLWTADGFKKIDPPKKKLFKTPLGNFLRDALR